MTETDHILTILGLGPGDVAQLTLEAADALGAADRIYVRTVHHPTVEGLSQRFPDLGIHSFDDLYESGKTFEEIYAGVAGKILELAAEGSVVYCVPGSPSIDETTVKLITALAKDRGFTLQIVQGL